VEPDSFANDLGEMREIVAALHHVWDVPVLILLARRPLRFMAIKRALQSAAHRPDPKVLDLTLKRLTQQRYVQRQDDQHVSPYTITTRGRLLLARIQALIEADRQQRKHLGDNSDG
jgi:DNA-binding HxlR family transcriptional regulator